MATLGAGRYLLGVLEVLLLVGFAWLGAARVRGWALPRFEGAPACLATGVIAIALLLWTAELLGTFGGLDPLPLLLLMGVLAAVIWRFVPGRDGEGDSPHPYLLGRVRRIPLLTLVALLVGAVALVHFAFEGRDQISSGMTGFDSTWYHGPFAAGFFQSGDTLDLHFIAPQFLAWFYPANGEIFHAVGMLAFGRDILSPLLNIGWFAGCLLAAWCIGRPYKVAPWSLILGAVALSVPALSDQAGEARNDIVGIFFLLAAVAVALNAWATRDRAGEQGGLGKGGMSAGALAVAGLAVGLAAGTKLNFLLPATVLVIGLALVGPRGGRWRAFWVSGLGALAGGGYWYLRNLVHTGNPLPWVDGLGPISLPAPDQALGGREAHSVLGYLTDGTVWSDWLLPGLQDGLWFLWPLLGAAALAGLVLCLLPSRGSSSVPDADQEPGDARALRWPDPVLALMGLVGLATALAWLVAPTSASGPEGMPRGFESGLRYLAPALVLGLALLPAAPLIRDRLAKIGLPLSFVAQRATNDRGTVTEVQRRWLLGGLAGLVGVAALAGYAYQRHYLEERYEHVSFSAPGLNEAFDRASDLRDVRIATTSTRQYPLFGDDLSNEVVFIGEEKPQGGFEPPTTCRRWRELLNEGDFDYAVTTWDRVEPGKPPFPPQTRWTEDPSSQIILRTPPTVVFELSGPLDPSACPQ
ncbi:MAG: hypothetical protein QOE75_2497 [Solirubrobacterales bacterium]|jgi:hypothetical protein|nr:hypothetical protein [Solirubrobacterales bacterium]